MFFFLSSLPSIRIIVRGRKPFLSGRRRYINWLWFTLHHCILYPIVIISKTLALSIIVFLFWLEITLCWMWHSARCSRHPKTIHFPTQSTSCLRMKRGHDGRGQPPSPACHGAHLKYERKKFKINPVQVYPLTGKHPDSCLYPKIPHLLPTIWFP